MENSLLLLRRKTRCSDAELKSARRNTCKRKTSLLVRPNLVRPDLLVSAVVFARQSHLSTDHEVSIRVHHYAADAAWGVILVLAGDILPSHDSHGRRIR